MPQNDRNSRNRKRRRAYDQARDDRRGGQSTQRRSSAGAGSDLGYSGYAGYSSGGHPITNPNYDPDAPRPSRYTERTVNYGSYPDNSITFPTGGRSSQSGAQRPRSGQNGQRRTSGGNQRNRRPASGQNRNAQRRPQNAQNRSGQRMRPVQGQNARRDPVRREGRKKRKLTRAAIRRRRLMRRLTALVMLLCVIGAGVYLTVTMLFKISSIQVQTADGVVQEAGGYTSDQILQALDVHPEENIFSFDPGSTRDRHRRGATLATLAKRNQATQFLLLFKQDTIHPIIRVTIRVHFHPRLREKIPNSANFIRCSTASPDFDFLPGTPFLRAILSPFQK